MTANLGNTPSRRRGPEGQGHGKVRFRSLLGTVNDGAVTVLLGCPVWYPPGDAESDTYLRIGCDARRQVGTGGGARDQGLFVCRPPCARLMCIFRALNYRE